jgi:hypothetical protein
MNLFTRVVFGVVVAILLGFAGLGLWNWSDGGSTVNAQERHEVHPHLVQAIGEMKEARRELKEAGHDFGGHRVKAIEAIDVAVQQLETALRYDRR